MKILNALERAPGMVAAQCKVDVLDSSIAVTQTMADGMSILLRLLSPIAPHICHHLWRELEFGDDILTAPWPEPDALALIADEIELVVQVNGKKRGEVRVPRDADRAAIEKLVLADPGVQKFVAGQTIKKVVVVPGRLVNVVV
jgi:leucyl-tRNA synthetase